MDNSLVKVNPMVVLVRLTHIKHDLRTQIAVRSVASSSRHRVLEVTMENLRLGEVRLQSRVASGENRGYSQQTRLSPPVRAYKVRFVG